MSRSFANKVQDALHQLIQQRRITTQLVSGLYLRISKSWAVEPLTSYEKMLGFIRNTSTKTGLVVTAYLDRKEHPTGLKPDRQLISSLALKPSKVLSRWNYTIAPNL
jgi:hypothetical protein